MFNLVLVNHFKNYITYLSLGWEDTLEKEMATHSGILAWKIPWTEEPGGLQSMGLQRIVQDLATKQQKQYSCHTSVCQIMIVDKGPLMISHFTTR